MLKDKVERYIALNKEIDEFRDIKHHAQRRAVTAQPFSYEWIHFNNVSEYLSALDTQQEIIQNELMEVIKDKYYQINETTILITIWVAGIKVLWVVERYQE